MTSTSLCGAYPNRSRVQNLLTEEYGFDVQLTRITAGEGAFNFRGDTGAISVFVKVYQEDAKQQTQEACCRQSEIARVGGVPTAKLLYGHSGKSLVAKNGVMLSVWEWVEGTTNTTIDAQHATTIGDTLGRLHETFRHRFGATVDAPAVTRWHSKSVDGLSAQILDLRTRAVAGCGREGCQFDDIAIRTLDERLSDLKRLNQLRHGTQGLTAQVIHGDYAPPNLILTSRGLAAVVDFSPPDPFLISYELGRIAYFPAFNVDRATWYTTALDVIRGYLGIRSAARQDIVMSPRIAAIQLLTSLYGIREHFTGGGAFQEKLDDFWIARHEAARALIQDLADLELALADLVEERPEGA